MFIKVCPDLGFNDQAVAHWTYELSAPPDPPAALSARGRAAPEPHPPSRGAAGRSDVSRTEASRSAAEREDDDKDKAGPDREGAARDVVTPLEEVPVPQPTPTLTLYFVGGGEPVVLEDDDAVKVANYFGVPSSYMTVL